MNGKNRWRWWRRDSTEIDLLVSLATGYSLRSHRDIEGEKRYLLHGLDGSAHPVDAPLVERLRMQRLIETNQKFPSATFLLTEKGSAIAETMVKGANAVQARGFIKD